MEGFKTRYSELRQFFAGYFHQNWKDTLPDGLERTVSSALTHAFDNKNDAQLLQLQTVLRRFLNESADFSDETLHDILYHDFGSSYYTPGSGVTYRGWLETIDKKLERTLTDRMSPP